MDDIARHAVKNCDDVAGLVAKNAGKVDSYLRAASNAVENVGNYTLRKIGDGYEQALFLFKSPLITPSELLSDPKIGIKDRTIHVPPDVTKAFPGLDLQQTLGGLSTQRLNDNHWELWHPENAAKMPPKITSTGGTKV